MALTHFNDLYLQQPVVQVAFRLLGFQDFHGWFQFQEYDVSEVNLDQIYESLDKQIDEDVLKERKTGKKVVKKTTSKKKKKGEEEEEDMELEVKEEEEEEEERDSIIAEVKSEPP